MKLPSLPIGRRPRRKTAAAGGGGGGTSALAILANSMSAGTWAELVTTNFAVNGVVFGGATTGNILGDSNNGAWDPVHGKAHFLGQDHGMGGLRHIEYDETTNRWDAVADFGALGDSGGHGLNGLCCDSNNGDLYFARYGSLSYLAKKPYGSTWNLTYAQYPDVSNISPAAVFWSGALTGVSGSAGAVVIHETDFGQLWIRNIAAGTWTDESPFPDQSPGYDNVAAYNPNSNTGMFGGGENPSHIPMRMDSNHAVTILGSIGSKALSIRDGTLCHNPKPGSTTFLSIANDGHMWEYDAAGSAGGGTYTDRGVIPAAVNPPSQGAGSSMVVVIACSTYGVVIVLSADGGSSANVYLYKPA